MEIRISGLADGDYPFEFETAPEAIGLEGFVGTVRVGGSLRKSSNQFFLTGRVIGTYVSQCDRCLVEVRQEIDVPINVYYITADEASASAQEEAEVEVRTLHPDEHAIVLDEEVRQSISVEMPVKVLCREECRGLCPNCGADLNQGECGCSSEDIDPRWTRLAELFKGRGSGDQEG